MGIKKNWECEYCDKNFHSKNNCASHEKNCEFRDWECKYCHVIFDSKKEKDEHEKAHRENRIKTHTTEVKINRETGRITKKYDGKTIYDNIHEEIIERDSAHIMDKVQAYIVGTLIVFTIIFTIINLFF